MTAPSVSSRGFDDLPVTASSLEMTFLLGFLALTAAMTNDESLE